MEPRRIELPEAAKRCWPKAVELVGDLMSECATLEDDDWHLGGGTALAADWKHRTSTDIDILIAPGLSMTGLGPEAIGRIERRIEEQGGRRLEAPDQKLSVDYGPDGKVDIFSSGRQLPGHEEVVEIGGSRVGRLSDAQIFAGKLRRAIEGHVAARDLFDICYAAKTGRRGFDQALNALTEAEQRQIKSLWESAEMKIAAEASTKLSGINDEDLIPPEELVAKAVTTLKDQRYASTIIRAGRGRATVRTLTVNGRPNDYESTAATLERDFEARGFSRHLMRHNIRPRTVLEGVREHIDEQAMVEILHTEARGAELAGLPPKTMTAGGDPTLPVPPERPTAARKAEKGRTPAHRREGR